MKIKLNGYKGGDGIFISVPKRFRRFFPNYFTIEIETKDIQPRKKRERLKENAR